VTGDKARRMSASYFGGEVKETQHYKLSCFHANPQPTADLGDAHNAKEANHGPAGVHGVDVSDMMHCLTSEELNAGEGGTSAVRLKANPILTKQRRETTAAKARAKADALAVYGVRRLFYANDNSNP
jgi:hypothetical protein